MLQERIISLIIYCLEESIRLWRVGVRRKQKGNISVTWCLSTTAAHKRAVQKQAWPGKCLVSSSIKACWDWLTQPSHVCLSVSLCLLQDEWRNCLGGDISMFNQKANMCIIALLVFKPFSHYRHRSCLKALLQMFGSMTWTFFFFFFFFLSSLAASQKISSFRLIVGC